MAVKEILVNKKPSSSTSLSLIRNDRYSQVIRFRMNRFITGVDLSKYIWSVKVVNALENVDVEYLGLATIENEDELVIDWTVGSCATESEGIATFELEGVYQDENDPEAKQCVWQMGKRTIAIYEDLDNEPSYDESKLSSLQEFFINIGTKFETMSNRINNITSNYIIMYDSLSELIDTVTLIREEVEAEERGRIANENVRMNQEFARIDSEKERQSNELERISNETDRDTNETVRIDNENERIVNENVREANELHRNENEQAREDNEFTRINSENYRETETKKLLKAMHNKMLYVDNKIESVEKNYDDKISEVQVAIVNSEKAIQDANTAIVEAGKAIENSELANNAAINAQSVADRIQQMADSGAFNGQKGDKGDKGDKGNDGYSPIKGIDYFDGKDGIDGKDGEDGKDGSDYVISQEDIYQLSQEASVYLNGHVDNIVDSLVSTDGTINEYTRVFIDNDASEYELVLKEEFDALKEKVDSLYNLFIERGELF